MVSLFNVNIDKMVVDHTFKYQNANDNFFNEFKIKIENITKICKKKVEEQKKIMKQISEVKNKTNESCEKLKSAIDKLEHEHQILKSKLEELSNIKKKCKIFEEETEILQQKINTLKTQTTQVFREKRGTIKKIKKEINSFTYGVQLYEQFLQLNINIVNKEKFNIINIILKSLNNDMSYKVILEEMESSNDLKIIDILPHNQSVNNAVTLYNQNKDIQGMLAFLYTTKE